MHLSRHIKWICSLKCLCLSLDCSDQNKQNLMRVLSVCSGREITPFLPFIFIHFQFREKIERSEITSFSYEKRERKQLKSWKRTTFKSTRLQPLKIWFKKLGKILDQKFVDDSVSLLYMIMKSISWPKFILYKLYTFISKVNYWQSCIVNSSS